MKHRWMAVVLVLALAVSALVALPAKPASAATYTDTFTTSGTWHRPAGVNYVSVECWGGGGAGGAVIQNNSGGGGGGGGEYRAATVTVTGDVVVTIGAGGTPVNNAAGNAGGDSGFGLALVAKGGGGGGLGSGTGPGSGGAGGTGGTGGTSHDGGAGAAGATGGTTYRGGGGGGGAGSGGVGKNATGATAGGTTDDYGGAGGNGATSEGDGGPAPTTADRYGGGGGGGARRNSTNGQGGAGRQGFCVVTYTIPGTPTVSSTTPASPANNNSPSVIGSAEAGSTVKLYTDSSCTSAVAATGTAAAFASPGLTVSVSDNTTTTFYATATDAAGNVSVCSTTSVMYVEDSATPTTTATPAGGSYNTWPQSVTLSCDDGSGSGCASKYYCTSNVVGCTNWTAYTGALSIPMNTVLRFYSTDNAGNAEAPQTQIYADVNLIELDYFTALFRGTRVLLSWATLSEIDNAGFNLWRSTSPDGPYVKINESLIPAQGGPLFGATYQYTDSVDKKFFDKSFAGVNPVDRNSLDKKNRAYYYKLEDVDIYGGSTFHGPVSTNGLVM